MTTHYYPYLDDAADFERFPCGSLVSETSNTTAGWNYVDCGRCIRSKKRITAERDIIRQMGEFFDFMKTNNN